MGEIILYSTHCPMCKSIQRTMDMKKLEYQIVDNKEDVLRKADELKINSAPFAIIDGKVYTNTDLKTWIKEYQYEEQ